jgi:hypothetical protein
MSDIKSERIEITIEITNGIVTDIMPSNQNAKKEEIPCGSPKFTELVKVATNSLNMYVGQSSPGWVLIYNPLTRICHWIYQ